MEAHLYGQGLNEETVRDTMARRDQLLRHLAKDSGKRNARSIAQALQDAVTDKKGLERELVAAFNSMGYKALPLGGSDKPDGFADANLPPKDGKPQRYRVSLEAKSKEKEGSVVSNENVRISTIARHRNEYHCEHALVIGPDFSTTKGDDAALLKEIKSDHEKTGKTITLIRINDLARLVRLQPLKRLNHNRLRELFTTCASPDEAKAWIDKVADEKRSGLNFKEVLEAISEQQDDQPGAAVEYAALVASLRLGSKIKIEKAEVIDICRALARLAPEYVTALDNSVELNQRPDKVLDAIRAAIRDYPEAEQN